MRAVIAAKLPPDVGTSEPKATETVHFSFAFTGTVKKVVFDVDPHPDSQDEQALHEVTHQAAAAQGINN